MNFYFFFPWQLLRSQATPSITAIQTACHERKWAILAGSEQVAAPAALRLSSVIVGGTAICFHTLVKV